MTNQLFRDYLDGRIHVRPMFKVGGIVPRLGYTKAWVGPSTASLVSFDEMNLLAAGFKPIGMIETDGYQFDGSTMAAHDESLTEYCAMIRAGVTSGDMRLLAEMMEPEPDLDRDTRVAMAPRHGPAQSPSWRGRGRVTKYKRG